MFLFTSYDNIMKRIHYRVTVGIFLTDGEKGWGDKGTLITSVTLCRLLSLEED